MNRAGEESPPLCVWHLGQGQWWPWRCWGGSGVSEAVPVSAIAVCEALERGRESLGAGDTGTAVLGQGQDRDRDTPLCRDRDTLQGQGHTAGTGQGQGHTAGTGQGQGHTAGTLCRDRDTLQGWDKDRDPPLCRDRCRVGVEAPSKMARSRKSMVDSV